MEQAREDFTIDVLKQLGLSSANSFDEVTSDPVHWTMMTPA